MARRKKMKLWIKMLIGIVLMFIIVNILLALATKFLPIKFVTPESVAEGAEIFFTIPLGPHYVLPITQTIVNTWVLMLLIILILVIGTRNISIDNPGKMQLLLEEYYNFVVGTFLAGYGEYKKAFVSFFSALFAFIMFSNISLFLFPFVFMVKKTEEGILLKPFFRTPTADLNTPLGLAIIVFIIFVGSAIKRQGIIGYLKELSHPFILMFPINLISEVAKPISISVRLFGNMFAGLIIVTLMYSLNAHDISFAVGWPNVLQVYLDLFIGILQAFIFTILSSVYIRQMLIGENEL